MTRGSSMRPVATRVRQVGHGERHRAQPVAFGIGGRGPTFAARETLPGRTSWNPAANGRRPHRRRRQGHRRQALRLRFSRRRSPGLAGEDRARHPHPRARRHARLYRHRPRALDRRVEAHGGRHRGRSCARRHPRSRILCRRPVLPGRPDADLSRPAGGAADLRGIRRLRSGAAQDSRRRLREIRRGDRRRRDARLWRLPLYPRRRGDARGARCLFTGPRRLGQSRQVSKCRAPHLDAARDRDRGGLRQGGDPWRADPRRTGRNQSGAADARPRIRNAIRRPGVPRAGKRARLVRCGRQKP